MLFAGFAVFVRAGDEFADGEDQGAQVVFAVVTGAQGAFFQFGAESAAQGLFEQSKFIRIVGVEGGAMDLGALGDVLYRDGAKSLLGEQFAKGLLNQAASPFDTEVELFGGGSSRQHFVSFVAYPTKIVF